LQDRYQQVNMAGYEIKNIDKQILTQQIRINIANQEITNQQKQIDNAQEVEDFLRNKYTNQELYSWMEGQIRTLYYQAYTLAYDLAKKAEKVFRFERGLTDSNFIQFGYWDVAHDGLMAGERLYVALKQLEAAYQEKRAYDYEVSKPISLRQVNPLALIQLKETGSCEFTLPEVLFDMDYPGHYMRRIKSVALSVPCVVGPYTSLNCTLRLLEHKFRTSAIAKDKNDYPEKTDETDDRFSTVNIPITSIAVSSGQNDSGVFELNFRDERYIPFEGAGAISKWRLELPDQFRQFDYDTITDVIMQVRYTAVEGGDKLKKPAADSVLEYIKSVEQLSQQEGLFVAFDLKHDFSSEWYKATQPPAGATERVLMLNNLNDRLPIFTKGRQPDKIQATDVYVFTSANLSSAALTLTQGTDDLTFTDGPAVGTMKSFVIKDISSPIDSWQLKIQDVKTKLEKMWLLIRYVLK
jgi:Tc toxin complex TcA C-terminal TcB-binding domain